MSEKQKLECILALAVPRLVRELETETAAAGYLPLEVTVRVKPSNVVDKEAHGACYDHTFTLGERSARPIIVTRIARLRSEYDADLALLEGEYDSLKGLQRKIRQLDAFYGARIQGCFSFDVQNLVKNAVESGTLVMRNVSGHPADEEALYDPEGVGGKYFPPASGVPMSQVYQFLSDQGLPFLRHCITAGYDGVYDDRIVCFHETIYGERERIADVFLKQS